MRSLPSDASDAEVAEGIAAGSPDALRLAFERWGTLIHTIAVRALRDVHDAEEITQQVFVAAWSSRHLLRPGPDALPRWLVGIATNRIADLRRSRFRADRRTGAAAQQLDPSPPPGIDDKVVNRLVVLYELERLGSPRSEIVRMAYADDIPLKDIAAQMNMPVNTVKSHLRRGLAELRQRFGGDNHG
ncbi:RNA polymerase sigma factor [Granulicoccus sp. GXG6511]|uniref:RNA polymerase sigma factor n=1 Tax=Granulicoccus sp. GXG6511 TaxID=3381351 RepID=UPI003D7D8C9E